MMNRARSDMDDIAAAISTDLVCIRATLRKQGPIETGSAIDEALAGVATFVSVALRVMTKTNPSKVRDAALAENIKAIMDGTPMVDLAPHLSGEELRIAERLAMEKK